MVDSESEDRRGGELGIESAPVEVGLAVGSDPCVSGGHGLLSIRFRCWECLGTGESSAYCLLDVGRLVFAPVKRLWSSLTIRGGVVEWPIKRP